MASSLMGMATQSTLFLHNPTTSLFHSRRPAAYTLPSAHTQIRTPKLLYLPPLPKPLKSRISASNPPAPKSPAIKLPNNPNPVPDYLTGSTRTVTTLVAVGLTASKFFANGLFSLAVQLKEPLLYNSRPAFFAAARGVSSGSLNTPLTAVAIGMAKWVDLYTEILMVRVWLSWFPNLPWDKQPLSALRDLCDPFLNLFNKIIPPKFGVVDVSSLFAFAVLGTLGSILNSNTHSYWGSRLG